MKKCTKRKFDYIDASLIVERHFTRNKMSKKRREQRCYFCYECQAWHLTKKKL